MGIKISGKLSPSKRRGNEKKASSGGESAGPETKAKLNFGECTYCDPNFMAIPGIEQALKGYDVPMGNPIPGTFITHLKIFTLGHKNIISS